VDESLTATSAESYQQLLFPQEFREGDVSPETLQDHIGLADWTIGALERAIKVASDARETEIKNDRNAVGGTRRVLETQLGDK
jgi:hypothetical protein